MGDLGVTVTAVQSYAARKPYICPGCNGTIYPGMFHLVVVPDDEPDLRRHWHQGCWHKEMRRLQGSLDRARKGLGPKRDQAQKGIKPKKGLGIAQAQAKPGE